MSAPSVIRAARHEDVALIGPIQRAADRRFAEVGHPEMLDDEVIPEEAARRAVEEGRLTVAEVDGVVVGWLLVGRLGGELCVGQVSVAPEHGRRGVGAALLRDVIARARDRGELSIVLNTQADVPWNMPWYARHGFAVVARPDWTAAMAALADEQAAHGLDWTTRVHMRLALR